jgi:hypothetical protein
LLELLEKTPITETMKELLLQDLRTIDLAKLCDGLSIETPRTVRTSKNKLKELLMKKSYKEIKTGISKL